MPIPVSPNLALGVCRWEGEDDYLQRLCLQHADIVRLRRSAETIIPKYRNSAIRLRYQRSIPLRTAA